MEWLRLVELLSVLCSLLISVHVFLSCPAGWIPEGGVHGITWTIIYESHPWTVQVSFVCYQFISLQVPFMWKLSNRVSSSKHWLWVSFGMAITGSESGLVWLVLGVVVGVSGWHSSGAVSSGCWFKWCVMLGNMYWIKSRWCHLRFVCVQILPVEDISALLRVGFLEQRVCFHGWHVSLILRNNHISPFHWVSLDGEKLVNTNFCYNLPCRSYRCSLFCTCFRTSTWRNCFQWSIHPPCVGWSWTSFCSALGRSYKSGLFLNSFKKIIFGNCKIKYN